MAKASEAQAAAVAEARGAVATQQEQARMLEERRSAVAASVAAAMEREQAAMLAEANAARVAAEADSRRAAAAHFKVSVSFVVNLVRAYRTTGRLAPKPRGGRRHAKLDPHREFLLDRVAEKEDITMPELASDLEQAVGVRADPASLSRWLIRNGLSFKKKPSGERMRSARRAPGARGVEG